MDYRLATKEDLDVCIQMVGEAFKDYIYYNLYIDDMDKRMAFLDAIQKISLKTSLDLNKIFIGIENGEIVSVAQLETPSDKKASFLYYVFNGGINVIKAGGLINTLKWFNMFDKTGKAAHRVEEEHWYLTSLAVNSKFKGKGYGRDIIHNCVIPYVKEHNGKLLTLITNDDDNRKFYDKVGFEMFSEEHFVFNGIQMGNWAYKMNIQ